MISDIENYYAKRKKPTSAVSYSNTPLRYHNPTDVRRHMHGRHLEVHPPEAIIW